MQDQPTSVAAPLKPFRLEEATIDDLHHAIRDGRTMCVAVVQHYIARLLKGLVPVRRISVAD